jgi:peptidoglycan-associated lipoprotein
VLDKLSSLPIENAKISIKDLSGNLIEMVSTDAKGKYSFESEIMDKYDVTAVKEGYLQNSISIEGNQVSRYLDDSDILLSPSDYGVGGRVLYAENDLPAEGAILKLFDENGVLVAEAVTGPDGKYSFGLESDHIYTLECIKFGYPDQEIELDTKTADATMFKSDFRLFKMEEGTVVRLDNIYYDYDKWEIRSDAAIELNKLVTIMEDNPSMTIELGSHTDSRGSPAYNSALSQKRAQAVVDYLTDKGVAKNRIKSKGYGESKILNKCVEGAECSEDDHQLNRRTEFKILKI